jgi:hypothetical protein
MEVGDPNLMNPADPQPVEASVAIDGNPAIRCHAISVRIEARASTLIGRSTALPKQFGSFSLWRAMR